MNAFKTFVDRRAFLKGTACAAAAAVYGRCFAIAKVIIIMTMRSSMSSLAAASGTSGMGSILRQEYAETSSTAIRQTTQKNAMSRAVALASLALRSQHSASVRSANGSLATRQGTASAAHFAATR